MNPEYELRPRLVYKEFVSDDDIVAEVLRASKEVGFEEPPAWG